MTKNNSILIAKVSSVFGIKGQVKLIVYSNEPKNIEKYQIFDQEQNPYQLTISNKNKTIIGYSSNNPIVIVSIDGVNSRNDAEKFRSKEFFVSRDEFEETNDDEFYFVDLLGLEVVDNSNNKKIGKIINVLEGKTDTIIEIEFEKSKIKENYQKIEQFAFKNKIFPEVNIKKGFITIDLPEMVEIK